MNEEKMELGKKMDVAIHYTAKNLSETGHNPKPVLLHSIRVAELLYNLDYSEDTVIAAILHDLIEDTEITYDDIKNNFGSKVADIVLAVSFNPNIEDHLEQSRKMFEHCINNGIDAISVKCSDLIQNIDYVQFVDEIEKKKILLNKYELFLDMAYKYIGKTELYQILKGKYDENIMK